MIDQDINRCQIKNRRLEIAVAFGELSEREVELRKHLLEVEAESAALSRELAELDLLESKFPPPLERRTAKE